MSRGLDQRDGLLRAFGDADPAARAQQWVHLGHAIEANRLLRTDREAHGAGGALLVIDAGDGGMDAAFALGRLFCCSGEQVGWAGAAGLGSGDSLMDFFELGNDVARSRYEGWRVIARAVLSVRSWRCARDQICRISTS